ncbi:MAG: DUF1566 domain-containing protein [Gammaproteobacteria bacterium]|nr:DUF1566 domain-containing protein [Gammaproteobacteria bacterium]
MFPHHIWTALRYAILPVVIMLLSGCSPEDEATSTVDDGLVDNTYPGNIIIEARDRNILISWDAVENASAYRVYLAAEKGVTPYNYDLLDGGIHYEVKKSPLVIANVSNSVTYYLVITSVIDNKEGAASGQIAATPVTYYQRVASDGSREGVSVNNFACVEDLRNGLMWEVKTDDGTIHDRDNRYTLQSFDNVVSQVNHAALCAYTDWRMPTKDELKRLVFCDIGPRSPLDDDEGCYAGHASPTINLSYFPKVQDDYDAFYWSSADTADASLAAWGVNFYDGRASRASASEQHYVRLVRDAS